MWRHRGVAVVRTDLLAGVAPKNPSMQLPFVVGLCFDGAANDATGGIDGAVGADGPDRAGLHAGPTVPAGIDR